MIFSEDFFIYKPAETTIRLIDVSFALRAASAFCGKWFNEFNIPESRRISIVEWFVLELYDRKLRELGLCVNGHYADDDGKTIISNLDPMSTGVIMATISVIPFAAGAKRINAMISGSTLIISKEI